MVVLCSVVQWSALKCSANLYSLVLYVAQSIVAQKEIVAQFREIVEIVAQFRVVKWSVVQWSAVKFSANLYSSV